MPKPEEKHRAPYNRTITLNATDRERLLPRLLPVENVDAENFRNRTLLGDLFVALEKLPDAFADLIIADPPYNLSKDFGTVKFNATTDSHYSAYLESWLPALCRKLKPGGTLYLCGDWRSTSALQQVLQKHLSVVNRITWQREKGRGTRDNWKNCMEDIWMAVKNPRDYTFCAERVMMRRKVRAPYRVDGQPKDWQETEKGNFRDTYPSNFWDDLSVPFWAMPENTEHPTQKPEKLYAKLILASSNEGDMVFDPFLGSGTSNVVAKKLGRNYCGVEVDETFCLLTEKRLELAASDRRIQGYADGVFWERHSSPKTKQLSE